MEIALWIKIMIVLVYLMGISLVLLVTIFWQKFRKWNNERIAKFFEAAGSKPHIKKIDKIARYGFQRILITSTAIILILVGLAGTALLNY